MTCQQLNVHGVHDVRQTEMHTAEPLVSDPSSFVVEIYVGKLPGIDQIPGTTVRHVLRSTNLIILFDVRNNCHNSGRTVVIIREYYCYQLHSKFHPVFFSQGNHIYRHTKLVGIITVDFDVIAERMFCICQIQEKKWEYKGTVCHIFIDSKKTYDSFRREVLYNILIESGVPVKLG
jgi:hypothetical protein